MNVKKDGKNIIDDSFSLFEKLRKNCRTKMFCTFFFDKNFSQNCEMIFGLN